jgi:RTX calcium-binding nonapeptide repeat (4 copies)
VATFVTFDDIVLSSAERPMPALHRGFVWSQAGLHPTNDNSGQETSPGPNAGRFALSGGWAVGGFPEAGSLSSLSLNGSFDFRSVGFPHVNVANFVVTVKAYGNGVLVGTRMITFANDGGPLSWTGPNAGSGSPVFDGETEFASDLFSFDELAPERGPAEVWVGTRDALSTLRDSQERAVPADDSRADDDDAAEDVKYVLATLPAFGILLLDGRLMQPKDPVAQVQASGDGLRSSASRDYPAPDKPLPTVSEKAGGEALAFKRMAPESPLGFARESLSVDTSGTDKAYGFDTGYHISVVVGGVTLALGHNEIAAGPVNALVGAGPQDDAIRTRDGNDVVLGGAGDDEIDAGNGDNVVDGGAGNDKIAAGSGNDHVQGGAGDDEIDAGDGDNRVSGGAGNDTIRTGSGRDHISGGSGNDTIHAGGGNDRILLGVKAPEGDGNDTIFGGAGADEFVIAGHFGFDSIKDFGLDDHLVALDPVRGGGAESPPTNSGTAGSETAAAAGSDTIGTVPQDDPTGGQGAFDDMVGPDFPEELGFLSKDADWAALNGGFIITERYNNDLLLTFNFGRGEASMLTLNDFFEYNSGPGFGADTPDGILDDEAAVPILAAIFSSGSASPQDYDFLI